jgi:hypothetical protein
MHLPVGSGDLEAVFGAAGVREIVGLREPFGTHARATLALGARDQSAAASQLGQRAWHVADASHEHRGRPVAPRQARQDLDLARGVYTTSTSALGSASAKPFSCASRTASSSDWPVTSWSRMKLLVSNLAEQHARPCHSCRPLRQRCSRVACS